MKNKIDKVKLPIPDTVPGPGNYKAEIIDGGNPEVIPAVDSNYDQDMTGQGVANDVPSSSTVPEPQ